MIPALFHTRVSPFYNLIGVNDTSVDMVETKPHLEALTKHNAGHLAVPHVFPAIEVKDPKDFGSGITAMSGGAGEDPTGAAGDGPNRVDAGVRQACA